MLLTVKTLSHRLQIKPSTLYAWASQGKLPSLKIHGLLRFEEEAITAWLESFRTARSGPFPHHARRPETEPLDQLIASARRGVYSTRHGETRPQSSLTRKEGSDGAL
jgi:excisionase family DNA binding protein